MVRKIDTAIFEAQRFIKRAAEWRRKLEKNKYPMISGSQEGGAAKRSSMDLTRALADFRKGRE